MWESKVWRVCMWLLVAYFVSHQLFLFCWTQGPCIIILSLHVHSYKHYQRGGGEQEKRYRKTICWMPKVASEIPLQSVLVDGWMFWGGSIGRKVMIPWMQLSQASDEITSFSPDCLQLNHLGSSGGWVLLISWGPTSEAFQTILEIIQFVITWNSISMVVQFTRNR